MLDDHPAVLAGLQRLVGAAEDLQAVAAVDSADALRRALDHGGRADVVVLDYDLARGDGLAVCQQLKERVRPPAVVVYSAYAGPALTVAALMAGADAVVDKRTSVRDLLTAIRRVAAGELVVAEIPREVRDAAIARVEDDDVPIAAMLLAGTPHDGIADALGIDRRQVRRRTRRIIARLRPRASVSWAADAPERPPAVAAGR
jgi:two-component system response regulator DevR